MRSSIAVPPKNFWVQPCAGFDDKSQGVTEAALQQKEKDIGFPLPKLYGALMQQQNGGYVRNASYWSLELKGSVAEPIQLFINGAQFEPLQEPIQTFYDFLLLTTHEDQIEEWIETGELGDLKKLVVFSLMDGHALAMFDYGWKSAEVKAEPEVVFFEEDWNAPYGYVETLRIESFASLVAGLRFFGYEAESFYFGLVTYLSLEKVAEVFFEDWQGRYQRRGDDRYGWFNFDYWFSGSARKDNAIHRIIISPNRHCSGTFLFSDDGDCNVIIEIEPQAMFDGSWGEAVARCVEKKLLEFDAGGQCRLLLSPFEGV